MSSVNKVILIGNVGNDPEVRYLDRGLPIATFRLATDDPTEWHNIVLWRNLAEWAEKYVRKGMKLYIEGHLHTRSWEKDEVMHSKTEIIAENVQFLSPPDSSPSASNPSDCPQTTDNN